MTRFDESGQKPGVACPTCGEEAVVSIVYGMPDSELFEAAERNEVVLGGCMVEPDQPTDACTACGRHW